MGPVDNVSQQLRWQRVEKHICSPVLGTKTELEQMKIKEMYNFDVEGHVKVQTSNSRQLSMAYSAACRRLT